MDVRHEVMDVLTTAWTNTGMLLGQSSPSRLQIIATYDQLVGKMIKLVQQEFGGSEDWAMQLLEGNCFTLEDFQDSVWATQFDTERRALQQL